MIRRTLLSSIALATLAISAQNNITFKDRAGNLTVTGLSSWRVTRVEEDIVRMTGRGSPFTAVWSAEGLTLSGREVEGKLRLAKGGRLTLSQASVKGNVLMRVEKATNSGDRRATVLTGAALDYDAAHDRATIRGAIGLVSKLERSGEQFELRGSGARLILHPLDQRRDWPARSGSIDGPVILRLYRTRAPNARERAEGQTDPVPLTVNGRADRLAFDEDGRRIVLSGSVTIDASDAAGFGAITANRAIVRLNEIREVVDIDFDGAPGVARIRDGGRKR